MKKTRVFVRLKEGVLDPQGKTVEHALHALGFNQVTGVRIGKVIEMEVEGDNESQIRESVADMCRKLLVNPVIEDFEIAEA